MKIKEALHTGFKSLGFDQEVNECLFLCEEKNEVDDLDLKFNIETARKFDADAVFFRKELEHFKPQIYIYDFTGKLFTETEIQLTEIHKKVWSSGNVPLVCVFYDTEIKILNCTTPIKNDKPEYLQTIELVNTAEGLYDKQFAIRIKTGTFWEEEENKKKFSFSKSSYEILIKWIKELKKSLFVQFQTRENERVINKIIIQSILIKYLEEKRDHKGKNPFPKKYFSSSNKINTYTDILQNGNLLVDLLEKLHKDLNGNLFDWTIEEKGILKTINLEPLADALKGYKNPNNPKQLVIELEYIRYYEFNFVPVELISRLYEEFLAGQDDQKTQKQKKQKEGIYYTPSHLAKMLVDEAMPLKKDLKNFEISTYKVLDPSCGSGIFLVLAFKRLVQWWKIQQWEKTKDFTIKPDLEDLKNLLRCVYGVDKEEQATKLSTFSLCLALCDELSPMQIISDLRFDDLTQTNILYSDFFIDELETPIDVKNKTEYNKQAQNFSKIKALSFDLVIGNPPFKRSGNKKDTKKYWQWDINGKTIAIPSKQIALKFLVKSIVSLKENGTQCLILKSSGFLYNSTSDFFKREFLSNYNVNKILDFTALARNSSLWENGADVDTLAVFTQKIQPKYDINILHITFRRTKAIKDRILFEIDDYDKHYINRFDAINNQYIWKNNLLGGGRINVIVDKLTKLTKLNKFLEDNRIIPFEGEGGAKSIPNNAFEFNKIDESLLPNGYFQSFKNTLVEKFNPPILLIKENLELPISCSTNRTIPFNNEVVGFQVPDNGILMQMVFYLETFKKYLKFYLITTSGKTLVYKNTAIKMEDILNFPFDGEIKNYLNSIDEKIIDDVVSFNQFFLRNGENSKTVKQIEKNDFKNILCNYGKEFSTVLNEVYEQDNNKFRLSEVLELENLPYTITVFRYDDLNEDPNFNIKIEDLDIKNLTINEISSSLTITRIVKIYEENTIIFIKPNQYRYWLSSIAYRDADKCFIDLIKAGY
ncbi:N-6 DNA methylase [Flavobacterium sp. 1]|uniref:Eco57I restriction-modification methylase domain-containing protein n=1 Tax=Flavobacterium sp. 1 TaxID=2035200 RepID=UPI000CC1AEC2|nr:N-6 DNA methylase [Flavobacterium sp. 1]PJJ10170.1 N-6 DNA methylase [Flavobacterium sp. 1]